MEQPMPRRKSSSPEEVLDAYHALTPEGQAEFCRALLAEKGSPVRQWVVELLGAHLREKAWLGMIQFLAKALHEENLTIAHRLAKPRNMDRDDTIIRLRDEEGLTFGEIPGRLKTINKKWAQKDGKSLKRKAVEKAYQRRKEWLAEHPAG
jgi:hypothetical protein